MEFSIFSKRLQCGTGLTDHYITCLLFMGFSVITIAQHSAKSLCDLISHKGDLVTAWAPTAPYTSCNSPTLTSFFFFWCAVLHGWKELAHHYWCLPACWSIKIFPLGSIPIQDRQVGDCIFSTLCTQCLFWVGSRLDRRVFGPHLASSNVCEFLEAGSSLHVLSLLVRCVWYLKGRWVYAWD